MIIIDNVKDNFRLQKANGLHIIDFYDDVKDTELTSILQDLIDIANNGKDDVRKLLYQLRNKMSPYARRNLFVEKEEGKKKL